MEIDSKLTTVQLLFIGLLLLGIGFASGYLLANDSTSCDNAISYYDKDGKNLLYQDCSNY